MIEKKGKKRLLSRLDRPTLDRSLIKISQVLNIIIVLHARNE